MAKLGDNLAKDVDRFVLQALQMRRQPAVVGKRDGLAFIGRTGGDGGDTWTLFTFPW